MGRSRKVPSFGRLAGAKLIVTLRSGKVKFEFIRLLLTLSLASLMDLLPIPTILNAGRPRLESPSTSIIWPVKPDGTME